MGHESDNRPTFETETSRLSEGAEGESGFSITPYLATLWLYRQPIVTAVLGTAVVCALGGTLMYLRAPSERTAAIQVRLLFDGAAEGRYPNGTLFAASELVSIPVVTDVYEANDLKRFEEFNQFKSALTVLRSNPELVELEGQYTARLADPRLAVADRGRLEEEFRRKREQLVDPIYSVSLRRIEGVRSIPADLLEKALNDLLDSWARHAAAKGAIRYPVEALSRNMLQPDLLTTEDYLVAVDVLRLYAVRVLSSIAQIESLPGASTFRYGKEGISLGEIRTNIQDVLQLQLDPLMSLIKSSGLAKDRRSLQIYIDGRLADLNLDRVQGAAVLKAVQDAFQNYTKSTASDAGAGAGRGTSPSDTTLMPQLTADFLDKLMELAAPQNTDSAYRQRLSDNIVERAGRLASIDREVGYYQSLSASLRSMPPQNQTASVQQIVEQRSAKALEAIGTSIDRVMGIYEGLSAQNLNPSTVLFRVTSPFSMQTSPSLPIRSLVTFSALAMVLAFFGACVLSLGYDWMKASRSRSA